MELISEKIKRLRNSRHWSQEQLAGKAKLNRGYINNLEQGGNKHPGLDKLMKLAKAFNVPIEELYAAAGYTELSEVSTRPSETPEELIEKLRYIQPVSIPVYSHFFVHAGAEHAEITEYVYRPRDKVAGENIEAFIVHGHCLTPRVEDGDIVITDRDRSPEPGNILLCLRDDELLVGRYSLKNGAPWLTNGEEEISLDDCLATAVVIEVIKRMV